MATGVIALSWVKGRNPDVLHRNGESLNEAAERVEEVVPFGTEIIGDMRIAIIRELKAQGFIWKSGQMDSERRFTKQGKDMIAIHDGEDVN